MKKVAIVSCYFQKNYGSMLQAYATQKILDMLNVENETICIEGFAKDINKAKYKFYLKKIFDRDTFKEKAKTVKLALKRKMDKEFAHNVAIRNECFKNFSSTVFRLSEKYNSINDITKVCKEKYSAVLVGSDQLWLPSNIYANYYTLNFVPDDVNKISYSTSFGAASLPDWQKDFTRKFLNRIDNLSVRELSGANLIKDLTGRDAQVVCDPTMLFSAENWMDIQKEEPFVKDKYIFCYFLGNNQKHREFAKKIKELTGYKIVALQHLDEYVKEDVGFADIAPYNVGPGEFLNLIRNAEFVCTDSFHGSVFSTLYRKKFFTFMRFKNTSTMSTNSRITSLLKILGLEDRMLSGDEDAKKCIDMEIDFDTVLSNLEEFRKDSLEFLKKSLDIK